MTQTHLNDSVLAEIDRGYARLIRRAKQQEFRRTVKPPPVIGSDYIPPEMIEATQTPAERRARIQNHQVWPPEVFRFFLNAPVIRRRKGEPNVETID